MLQLSPNSGKRQGDLHASTCICRLAKVTVASVHAGRIGAALGLLILFHQVWLSVRYEGHLTGSRVDMALHNLLDITLPTRTI